MLLYSYSMNNINPNFTNPECYEPQSESFIENNLDSSGTNFTTSSSDSTRTQFFGIPLVSTTTADSQIKSDAVVNHSYQTSTNDASILQQQAAADATSISSLSTNPLVNSLLYLRHDKPVSDFLYQLIKMLAENKFSEIIEWKDAQIYVHDPPRLAKEVLHKYFRHSNFSSFQRQLNYFGFRKKAGKSKMSPCRYTNENTTSDLQSLFLIKRKNKTSSTTSGSTAQKSPKSGKSIPKAEPIAAEPIRITQGVEAVCQSSGCDASTSVAFPNGNGLSTTSGPSSPKMNGDSVVQSLNQPLSIPNPLLGSNNINKPTVSFSSSGSGSGSAHSQNNNNNNNNNFDKTTPKARCRELSLSATNAMNEAMQLATTNTNDFFDSKAHMFLDVNQWDEVAREEQLNFVADHYVPSSSNKDQLNNFSSQSNDLMNNRNTTNNTTQPLSINTNTSVSTGNNNGSTMNNRCDSFLVGLAMIPQPSSTPTETRTNSKIDNFFS